MNYRLLLLEDEPEVSAVFSDLLQHRGYCLTVRTSRHLSVEPGFTGLFELFVIDAKNFEDSLEICGRLRRCYAHGRILMLGTPLGIRDRVAALRSGADDYLAKPIDPDELLVRVESLLRRTPELQRSEILSYEFGGMSVDFKNAKVDRGKA